MKKVLLGTSAFALATAYAYGSSASDFYMKIGGFYEVQVGYGTTDSEFNEDAEYGGVDVKRDNEIHFQPSLTLDNGIEIGAQVELEGASSGQQIDNAFVEIDGSFGRVLLGSESSAGNLMHYSAPSDGLIGANDGDLTNWIVHPGRTGSMATNLENAGGDTERITYFSPRMYGFQIGLSYARDGEEHSNEQVNLSGSRLGNIFDTGLNYIGSNYGFDYSTSLRYGIAFVDNDSSDNDTNPTVWSAGMNLGWQDWTIGGSFGERNENGVGLDSGNAGNFVRNRDGQAYDAGLSYETGAWNFAFTYFNGETAAEYANSGGNPNSHIPGRRESLNNYVAGARYSLAKGIDLHGFAGYSSFEKDNATDNDTMESTGFAIGTGMIINF